MASYAKAVISESVDGRGVKVVATASPGTLIHEGSSTPGDLHEIWLYVVNSSAASVKLTIEWGDVASPDDLIEQMVPPESGLFLLIPGLLIQGNATPLEVRAFAGSANVLVVHGYVNEIT